MSTVTPQIQYQLDHWGDDRGPGIIVAAGVLLLVTTIAVALRLWAQKLIKSRLDPDDYLVIISYILCVGICVNTIICVHYGIGQHLVRAVKTDPNPPTKMVNLFKAIFVEGFLWSLEIPLVKIAILLFYRRVLTANQAWFRWAVWLTIAYSIMWGVGTFIIVMLQCTPVPLFWNRVLVFYDMTPTITGTCLDIRASQVPSALTNCIGDLVLLLLPFPVLFKLQMNIKRKLEIMFIFGLGTFVLAASLVRLRFIWLDENSTDPTYDDAETLAWTPVECCVGVICACIPCMAPLRRYVGSRRGTTKTTYINTANSTGRPDKVTNTPLATLHGWPRNHQKTHSSLTLNGKESDEFGDETWLSKANTGSNTMDIESARHAQPAVINGAWAEPRSSFHSEDTPPNHIKVSKNLEWWEEDAHAR